MISSEFACQNISPVENVNSSVPHDAGSASSIAGYIMCPVHELRPHPSYARHKLSVNPSTLATLVKLGQAALQYPLMVTRERFIIDGYARWELAKQQGFSMLPCIEYDLPEQEALERLIQTHGKSHGFNNFLRIELALDLNADLQEKAISNQREGGRVKGLSTLTEAERVDSRTAIARLADASNGNVHKVKYILSHACASVVEAARMGEVSINRAYKWSDEAPVRQQEALRLFRIERGIKKKARILLAAHLAQVTPCGRDYQALKLADLVKCLIEVMSSPSEQSVDPYSIKVDVIDAPGRTIFVTQELASSLMSCQRIVR